ncbi:MAG: Cytochrome c554, partial [Chlorobi bacterium OLB5]
GGLNWQTNFSVANIMDITFTDSFTGWAVGSASVAGNIFKSTDAGLSWTLVFSSSTNSGGGFRAVHFLDNNTGWVTGSSGRTFKTTNSGLNWVSQPTGTFTNFDIFFADHLTGWITFYGSSVRKTTNGGASWFFQSLPTFAGYTLHFTNSSTGFIAGPGGIILSTSNGGTNWVLETSPTTETLNSIFFINNTTGFMCGANGTILTNQSFQPAEPTSLEAVADSSSRINLSWIDNSVNELGFMIERSTNNADWTLFDSVPQNTTAYPDTGLIPYNVYYYRVYSYNENGNSPYSNTAYDTARSYKSCDNIFVMITMINELRASDTLNHGQANSLIMKLNAACEHSGKGRFEAAINQIYAFGAQLYTLLNLQVITQQQADELVRIALDIIQLLQGGTSPHNNQQISPSVPEVFALYNNYPNPFNPVTKIKFDIPSTAFVKLIVYDIQGKEISALLSKELNAGTYSIDFDGSSLSSGVYFYKLTSGNYSEIKKMVLIK